MMNKTIVKYKRIMLKLSGEALMGDDDYGINTDTIRTYCEEIKKVVERGVEVALVIGGGNIFRGVYGAAQGMDRVQSDHMGMLATVINGLAIQNTLEQLGISTRLMSATEIKSVCEVFIRRRAIRHLEKKRVVILSGGTGNPFFTTDTAATLRALELQADVLIKATRVDGVFTADPEKFQDATKFDHITFEHVLRDKLAVMDMTAFTLSEENNLPIIVFNMNQEGALLKVIEGEQIGTLVDSI